MKETSSIVLVNDLNRTDDNAVYMSESRAPHLMAFVYSRQKSINSSQYYHAHFRQDNLRNSENHQSPRSSTNIGFPVRESFFHYIAKKNKDWEMNKKKHKIHEKSLKTESVNDKKQEDLRTLGFSRSISPSLGTADVQVQVNFDDFSAKKKEKKNQEKPVLTTSQLSSYCFQPIASKQNKFRMPKKGPFFLSESNEYLLINKKDRTSRSPLKKKLGLIQKILVCGEKQNSKNSFVNSSLNTQKLGSERKSSNEIKRSGVLKSLHQYDITKYIKRQSPLGNHLTLKAKKDNDNWNKK